MKSCTLFLVAALAACGDDGGGSTIDAGPRADAPPSCPPQTAPLATGTHELFIAFEGVSITLGDCDDSKTNCSSLVAQGTTEVPAFLMTETNRQTRITAIKGMVQDALAPFSIDVVTTRPTAGDYWMVVAGGTSDAVAGMTGVLLATNPTCESTNRNSVGLVFERANDTTDRAYADTIAGAWGSLVGLVPTTQSGDCMCTQTSCAHAQTCTWGTGVVTMPGNRCMRPNQNEQALLTAAVGCRSFDDDFRHHVPRPGLASSAMAPMHQDRRQAARELAGLDTRPAAIRPVAHFFGSRASGPRCAPIAVSS